jgi:peptidoglycan lytic transglycosylase
MRASRFMRAPIAVQLAVGALVFALPTAAAAAALTDAPAHTTTRKVHEPSHFVVRSHKLETLAGHRVTMHGRLLPAVAHRPVRLYGWEGHRWHLLARTDTRHGGYFTFHYRVHTTGIRHLRVMSPAFHAPSWATSGRRANVTGPLPSQEVVGYRATSARAGEVIGFQWTVASWYEDAGNTACGFHAYYGVANKTLPCGTKVTFSYGGRTITATVDDRGPFVAGRDFDLNQNASAALGMYGVASMLATAQ